MKLIVGLGNPGDEYAQTRHNVGFMVVDAFAKHVDASAWSYQTDKEAFIAEGHVAGEKMLVAKPQTYMNLSGRSVAAIAGYYKVVPADVYIVYDDADIPLGELRIRLNGSSGGHNGVQSVIDALSTDLFPHIRIGVSSPLREERKIPARDFVLGRFTTDEQSVLGMITDRAVHALIAACTDGIELAMNRYNGAVA